ncbi:hypothetical protein C8T65DRAFT_696207 [Cerioporus squamosus]|nr:hypothetical protein C8T65DRAFT_696207 [Cerioporus squamosus]
MLFLILAILLHVHLTSAPDHPLHGYEQELLILAFPASVLAIINVVPGLALTGLRSVTKSPGIALPALYGTANVFTTLSAVVALGCLRIRALVHRDSHRGVPVPSFVDSSAQLVQHTLRCVAIVTLGTIASVLVLCLPVNVVASVPWPIVTLTSGCPVYEQLLSDQAADISESDSRAALEDASSAAADTQTLLAQTEDALAELKGIHEVTSGNNAVELQATLTALDAEAIAARHEAAEAEQSEHIASDTIIAEQLKATIEHLERVAADGQLTAGRAQDAANLAKYAVTECQVKAECLEATVGMQTWELEQKDKTLEELLTRDSASHWEHKTAVLAAEMKTRNSGRLDHLTHLRRVKLALMERCKLEEERKAAAAESSSLSGSMAQATSAGAYHRQTSSPSAAQPSSAEELTAAGKARDTRVRSPLAREHMHHAQVDVVMSRAKDQDQDWELAAAQEEIAALKKALPAQRSPASRRPSALWPSGRRGQGEHRTKFSFFVARLPTPQGRLLEPHLLFEAPAGVDVSEDDLSAPPVIHSESVDRPSASRPSPSIGIGWFQGLSDSAVLHFHCSLFKLLSSVPAQVPRRGGFQAFKFISAVSPSLRARSSEGPC